MTFNYDHEAMSNIRELLAQMGVIGHFWSIEDVLSKAPFLTEEEAMEVLQNVEHHIDCEYGVSWLTIETAIDLWCQEHTAELYERAFSILDQLGLRVEVYLEKGQPKEIRLDPEPHEVDRHWLQVVFIDAPYKFRLYDRQLAAWPNGLELKATNYVAALEEALSRVEYEVRPAEEEDKEADQIVDEVCRSCGDPIQPDEHHHLCLHCGVMPICNCCWIGGAYYCSSACETAAHEED